MTPSFIIDAARSPRQKHPFANGNGRKKRFINDTRTSVIGCDFLLRNSRRSMQSTVTPPGIFIWHRDYSTGLGNGSPPVRSRGEAAVRSPRDEMPQKLKQFANTVHNFWLQKRSKSENFAQFTSCFHGGAKRQLWGLALPCLVPATDSQTPWDLTAQ